MKGVFLVYVEEFCEVILWHAKSTNSIPASHNFDFHTMSDLALDAIPMVIFDGTLVSIPDPSEPFARFFLFQNAIMAYESCETAAGEAATGEAKEE